jgi:hypothetical protein
MIPPWCLTVRCVGLRKNVSADNNNVIIFICMLPPGSYFNHDEYIAQGEIVPSKLEIPPTRPGVSIYYPLVLKNVGDTIMRFVFSSYIPSF